MVHLLCGLIFLIPSITQAEVVAQVRSTGYGVVVNGDRAAAVEEARRTALRQAVEEGVGVLLSGHTRVENFMAIEDHIYTHTSGYVRNYSVLDEGLVDEHTLSLQIEATVELGHLTERIDALEILIESAGNPYILCVEQVDIEENPMMAAAMRAEMSKLSNNKINVLVAENTAAVNTVESALRLAREKGADIVVWGEYRALSSADYSVPFSKNTTRSLGVLSASIEAKVEALWSDTGEVFSTHFHRERVAAGSELEAKRKGLLQSVETLSDLLVKDLVVNWQKKVYSGRMVRMVANINDVDLVKFEEALIGALGTTRAVQRRGYSGSTAMYDIESKNSGFDIARRLSLRGFDAFEVTIQQATMNTLKLQVGNSL